MVNEAFYQKVLWLELKAKILDAPAYNQTIHSRIQRENCLRILEAGSGSGAFTSMLLELAPADCRLVGFDYDEDLVQYATEAFANDSRVRMFRQDLYAIDDDEILRGNFDLVAGQALLEHTDLIGALEILAGLVRPGGMIYFPMNYDSPSILEPGWPDEHVDQSIFNCFDRYAIEGQKYGNRKCGDSRCGRHLWHACRRVGLIPLNLANSDWLLYPKCEGYSEDEKRTLELLIDFFAEASLDQRIPEGERLSASVVEEWRRGRRQQIDNNELLFICRQNTILAQRP